LGVGFTIGREAALIIGGGLGAPPLLGLARYIKNNRPGTRIDALLGFRSAAQVILYNEFAGICDSVHVSTDDGGFGSKGLATDMMGGMDAGMIYSCGPFNMMKAAAAIAQKGNIPMQVSLEERMACGIGTCLCCVHSGKRVCADGPVYNARQVEWHG